MDSKTPRVATLPVRGMSGLDLCDRIVKLRPEVPIIIVTGFADTDSAVAALRAGAVDFITKPIAVETLLSSLGRAARTRACRPLSGRKPTGRFEGLEGTSPAMQRVFDLIATSAPGNASVLITGETGTRINIGT